MWIFDISVSKNGSTITVDNVLITEIFNTTGITPLTTWVKADNVNLGFYLEVIGLAATTIQWVAGADIVENVIG